MSNENMVFVYGSLKRGFHNHDIIAYDFVNGGKNKGHTYIGPDTTVDDFKMVSIGSFPAIYFDREGSPVKGEVYIVDDATFELLDQLEGYPTHYSRKKVTLKSGNEAWIYYYPEPTDEDEYTHKENGALVWRT